MRGEAVEDYLKSVYRLGESSGRVSTQELAQHMGVSAASASRMLQRLAGMGLVDHELYRGASLTPEGERVAMEVIRHHRLLELYLHRALGYDWDRVHEEAERLEHYISEDLEARIFEVLGRPEVDPHGDVIPTLEGSVPEEQERVLALQRALSEAEESSRVVVQRVPSADAAKLRYLSEIGVVPGAELEVQERYPFGGGLRVRDESGEERVIGDHLAAEIRVSITDPADSR